MKRVLKNIVVWVLTIQARMVIGKYAPRIVAITGSVGKTSTKDAIYEALSTAVYARKNQKSFNAEIGIPLTILDRPNAWTSVRGWLRTFLAGLALILLPNHYPKWLILEVGVDHPGEMQKTMSWLPVDVAVFTHLGTLPVHVAFFDSPEQLKQEKMHLLSGLHKEGRVVYNTDDTDLKQRVETHEPRIQPRPLSYGFEPSDIQAQHLSVAYDEHSKPAGISFKVVQAGTVLPIELSGVLGRQHVYPVLAALTVAAGMEINLVRAAQSFKKYIPAPGRMRFLEGVRGSTIIDDTYNSSPIAVKEALNALAMIETTGRKIAVLGDMRELGEHTQQQHSEVGKHASSIADVLITVGSDAAHIATSAQKAGLSPQQVAAFDTAHKATAHIKTILKEGDVVLVKGSQGARRSDKPEEFIGSQGVRLERIVAEILAHPERDKKLLVRQEKEWGWK